MTDDEIAALVERFPLPEGAKDVVLNKDQLAKFFGHSVNTINVWIGDGMPALVEGTNGREWQFQWSACWSWRRAKDAAEQVRQSEVEEAYAAMRFALVGGKSGDSIRSLPPKERQQLYEVEASYEKLKRERNQSLDRDEVSSAMTDLLRIVRDSLSMLPDTLERKIGLDGKGVDAAVEHCDDILGELERAIAKFFADRPVITREARTDLFN